MRKFLYIYLLLIFIGTPFAFCQSYSAEEIIAKARSYLQEIVGDELFAYYNYQPGAFYDYQTKNGNRRWEELQHRKKTKGSFVEIGVVFRFVHPEYPSFLPNETVVRLGQHLELINEPKIDFIPDFIKHGKPSPWISEEALLKLANTEYFKNKSLTLQKQPYILEDGTYQVLLANIYKKEKDYSLAELLLMNLDGTVEFFAIDTLRSADPAKVYKDFFID